MAQFPERVRNYCMVNGLALENFFCKGSLLDGKIEEIGLFVFCNDLKWSLNHYLSDIIQITHPITLDLFHPNYSLNELLTVHLHLLIENKQFWLFASTRKIDEQSDLTACNPECDQIKHSKRQLQDLLKQQDQFINLISHDFRSPISTLIEGVNLVHENLKAKFELSEFDDVIMEQVKEELVQLLIYTNKLHDWTKLDIKADRTMFEEFAFEQVISSEEIYFSDVLEAKCIELVRNFSPDLCYTTDLRLFSLVIHHLLDNSIKFSKDGSTITINATHEYLQISDTGEGIVAEKLEQIRKGYLIKNRKLFGKGIGPGLGLNIVTRILGSLHYTYEIQSAFGIGTSFTIKMS